VDRVHESVDRERRRSTVDHGHRLGGGSPENSRNGAPVRGTSPQLREKGEGTAKGRTRPGDGGEQSAEEALGGMDVADSEASN
jgi:hypothetical protein